MFEVMPSLLNSLKHGLFHLTGQRNKLYHPLDGITNPKYKLLCFLTAIFCKEMKAFNWDGCCDLLRYL
jgi:hypothetical protein